MPTKVIAFCVVCLCLIAALPASTQAAPAAAVIFPPAGNVLAQFDFNGSVEDGSGNNRDATLIGGDFVPTPCGTGLAITDFEHGLDWSAHAGQLVHPYTIEMVLTPTSTAGYRKLFSFDDTLDGGWYYFNQGISLYPNDYLRDIYAYAGERHYLAFVSTAANQISVYFQGRLVGEELATFEAPPTDAVFFRDDSGTSRGEMFNGVVEALRISSIARDGDDIAATYQRVFDCAASRVLMPSLLR